MNELVSTAISGFFGLVHFRHNDSRGEFVKFYQQSVMPEQFSAVDWKEEYFSVSKRGVIRGMHFQTPPYEHVKYVVLIAGSALDVAVDLRKSSPTYGQVDAIRLSPDDCTAVFLDKGLAHGFQALEDGTTLLYKVSSEYEPENDLGVRYDSIGYDWPLAPIEVSKRDTEFPMLADFVSPF